jgi:hypothetical protein
LETYWRHPSEPSVLTRNFLRPRMASPEPFDGSLVIAKHDKPRPAGKGFARAVLASVHLPQQRAKFVLGRVVHDPRLEMKLARLGAGQNEPFL